MDPLGLVYDGQNSGAASVLGKAEPFNMYDWSKDRAKLADQHLKDAAAAAKAAKEANMKFMDVDYSKAWDADLQNKVLPKVDAVRQIIRPYYDKGVDVSTDIDAYQKYQKAVDEVNATIAKGNEYKGYYNVWHTEYGKNPTAFDEKTADNIKAFYAAPDDAIRDKMIVDGKVLVPKYNPYSPLKGEEIIPATKKTDVNEKGDVTTTVEGPDLVTIGQSAGKFMETPDGEDWYNKGLNQQMWSTKDEAKLWLAKNKAAKVGLINKKLLDEPKADHTQDGAYGAGYRIGNHVFVPTKVNENIYDTDLGAPLIDQSYQRYLDGIKKAGLTSVTPKTKEEWKAYIGPHNVPKDAFGFQTATPSGNKENDINVFFDKTDNTIDGIPKMIKPNGKGSYDILIFQQMKPGIIDEATAKSPTKNMQPVWVPYDKNETTFIAEWGGMTADQVYEKLKSGGMFTTGNATGAGSKAAPAKAPSQDELNNKMKSLWGK